MTAQVCEPLQKLISVKVKWSWNWVYQDLYDKAKDIIKQDCARAQSISQHADTGQLNIPL